ncbi:MAG: PspA/IM30 family protein [Actinobacteria bacterium]|nr:PspA/IM30 family protein [Thermoleophilia bacterium]MCB9010315.1 PspA/IM30 family protein [Actinomycetota bacterium]
MGIFDHVTSVFRGRAREHEQQDIGELMDVSLEKSEALIKRLNIAMADVTAGRMRLDIQLDELKVTTTRLEGHAREALTAGREDLARVALTRKSVLERQATSITEQRDALRAELEKMALTDQRLRARIEAFRTEKASIEARYTAAEAQAKVSEAVAGLSEDMADMTAAAGKARDRVEAMQARAEALDELLRSGSLEDLSADTHGLDAEVMPGDDGSRVDAELDRLRMEIAGTGQSAAGGGS